MTEPNPTDSKLMTVRAELVRDHLVAAIMKAVSKHDPSECPEELSKALEATADDPIESASPEAVATAGELARRGYLARLCEYEMFEPSRQISGTLAGAIQRKAFEGVEGSDALREVASELAREEPADRPNPGVGAPSWQVAGPGGHVRHYVAMETIAELRGEVSTSDLSQADAKRCWMFGFLLRACEESATEPA